MNIKEELDWTSKNYNPFLTQPKLISMKNINIFMDIGKNFEQAKQLAYGELISYINKKEFTGRDLSYWTMVADETKNCQLY